MKLFNLSDSTEDVSFADALRKGLGRGRGLFFPKTIPPISEIDQLLELDFIERSAQILSHLIGDELSLGDLRKMCEVAFASPAPLVRLSDNTYALELFHGPTLAFKDFGARFMAQCLAHLNQGRRTTILTATSGDTGAAVAHAFYKAPMIDVVVLYPHGKISPLQEALFCTLGHNIKTIAVEGNFDQCQALVKEAFDDQNLRETLGLNSANSINISRLLAQVCYYFEASAQLPVRSRNRAVMSVPSGNFGNLTAGLIAQALGVPMTRLIAATNANDTVPRYLKNGVWKPHPTQVTYSNAMDVSEPSNWARIEALALHHGLPLSSLSSYAIHDQSTHQALLALKALGYLCEPHGAVAWTALQNDLQKDEVGVFLCTAHPAKFKELVEELTQVNLALPDALARYANQTILSVKISPQYKELYTELSKLF